MDFGTQYNLQAHEGLLDTTEKLKEASGDLPFRRDEFNRGFAIYGFDFEPGRTRHEKLSLVKQGNLNLYKKVFKPLTEGAICVAMLVHDNIIETNNNRQVIFDFAP